MPIPEIPAADPTVAADPVAAYEAAREAGPVARLVVPGMTPMWVVTRYDAAKAVLADPRFRLDAASYVRPPLAPELEPYMRTMGEVDGPEHARLRKLVAPAFTARRAQAMRPRVERTVARLLAALPARADLVTGFARPLPMDVICDLVGIPDPDRPAWVAHGAAIAGGDGAAFVAAIPDIIAGAEAAVAARRAACADAPALPAAPPHSGTPCPHAGSTASDARASDACASDSRASDAQAVDASAFDARAAGSGGSGSGISGSGVSGSGGHVSSRGLEEGDVLAHLIRLRDEEGDRLSDVELVSLVWHLVLAGQTPANLITNALLALLEHPEQLALLRSEPERMPAAVEELTRWCSPQLLTVPRFPTEDVDISGTTVPRGEPVVVAIAAVNRDPRVFGRGLDVSRPPAQHLAYAHGPHYCLGAGIARVEVEVALAALIRANPVPAGDVVWSHDLGTARIAELPVELTTRG